jgi:endonuclease/exonuclease/phosphatase family metal-dependent hydrolase
MSQCRDLVRKDGLRAKDSAKEIPMKKSLLYLAIATLLLQPGTVRSEERLRIMAANTSSGNFQSYPESGPGANIFRALAPDVVLIQEWNVNSTRNGPNDAAALRGWVDEIFGGDFHFFREPGGQSIPNGVISRFPILESGEWDDTKVGDRDFAFARIDIPGDQELFVVSVHLSTMAGKRGDQARALVEAINRKVPPGDFLVVGGDFNTDRRNEAVPTTLRAVVDTMAPFPHDGEAENGNTNAGRRKPYDWLLADAELTALEVPLEIGDFSFPDGLVFDSRVFTQQELDQNFPPVRRTDSGATNMQHMAVVRDFRLAGGGPDEDFLIDPASIDFGISSASETPRLAAVNIEVRRPVALTAVVFDGENAGEFMLVEPDLRRGPASFEENGILTFSWQPAANDGRPREVKATLITDGEPGAVEVVLRGRAAAILPPGRR